MSSRSVLSAEESRPVERVQIQAPPVEKRARRSALHAKPGERKGRYHLPERLESASPIGYRTRVSLTGDEADLALSLLHLPRPTRFVQDAAVEITEQRLFEETSLGLLSARQSTNYRGHRQIALNATDSARLVPLLQGLEGLDAPVLERASHTLVVLSRPYRTPFTLLLTFIGHKPVLSLATVPLRALRKALLGAHDIPTIAYLQHLHVGVLADAIERATVVSSEGQQRAQVLMRPFCGRAAQANRRTIERITEAVGIPAAWRRQGWRIALVAQVGTVPASERITALKASWRRVGATLLSLRSERILPGVNQETSAPPEYHVAQDMEVPDALEVQCGRAALNAFTHWSGCAREEARSVVLFDRVDDGAPSAGRLDEVRQMLGSVTDAVLPNLPLWADLPLGRALSRNAARGRKAFALAGQRIHLAGLSRRALDRAGIDWEAGIRAFGAAACRSGLVAEIAGVTEVPEDCDMLAGVCLMAGPVNQNDIGKAFFGHRDLLERSFPDRDAVSMLVWTLKAKTVADPIGNEEQLMDHRRKGALVDLRPGPHEVAFVRCGANLRPMRQDGTRTNAERAYHDVGNFVASEDGTPIAGNVGQPWPRVLAEASPWT